MKKKLFLVVVVMLMTFGFAACGDNSEGVINMSGVWKLETIEQDGEVTNITEYESLGLSGTLTLNEDMSFSFDLLGDVSEGTWKAKSADSMSMTISGSGSLKGDVVDGKLVMEDSGAKLVFGR